MLIVSRELNRLLCEAFSAASLLMVFIEKYGGLNMQKTPMIDKFKVAPVNS